MSDTASFEIIIGHKFTNPSLLEQALTHPSAAGRLGKASYERLEFLGDTVLALIVAEMLVTEFPNEPEGALAKRHSLLVSGKTLAEVASHINLGKFLTVSESEAAAGGLLNPTNLEDSLEAVIGAIYMDAGLEKAKEFVLCHWLELSRNVSEPPKDPKSSLQEWAQGRGLPLPSYTLKDSSGPAHAPVFTIEATIDGGIKAEASGRSKKVAEQEAAALLLEKLLAQG